MVYWQIDGLFSRAPQARCQGRSISFFMLIVEIKDSDLMGGYKNVISFLCALRLFLDKCVRIKS